MVNNFFKQIRYPPTEVFPTLLLLHSHLLYTAKLKSYILRFTALLDARIIPKARCTFQNQTMSIHAIVIGILARVVDIEVDAGGRTNS